MNEDDGKSNAGGPEIIVNPKCSRHQRDSARVHRVPGRRTECAHLAPFICIVGQLYEYRQVPRRTLRYMSYRVPAPDLETSGTRATGCINELPAEIELPPSSRTSSQLANLILTGRGACDDHGSEMGGMSDRTRHAKKRHWLAFIRLDGGITAAL